MPRQKKPISVQQLLRESRSKQGATLRTLSAHAGISNAYLSQLEAPSVSTATPRLLSTRWLMLHKIAVAYGIPFAELDERLLEEAQRLKLLP